MTWGKILLAILLVAAAAAITVAGLRERPAPAVQVQTALARRGAITRTITAAGKIQAATTVKISSNLSGDLVELGVQEGERVTRGQVLGRIDRRRFEAAWKQAVAAQHAAAAEVQAALVEVNRASAERDRIASLTGRGMAATAELDRAQAEVDTGQARHSSAKQRLAQAVALVEEAANDLAKTTLSSPIDGTIIELDREVGERVRGSDFSEDVVMIVAGLSSMEVRIEVSEHEVIHLRRHQQAEVSIDALEGQSFPGRVEEIAQNGLVKNAGTEAEVTSFPVVISLATRPPGVLPGMSAEVRIATETRTGVVLVPIQAVTVRPGRGLPPPTDPRPDGGTDGPDGGGPARDTGPRSQPEHADGGAGSDGAADLNPNETPPPLTGNAARPALAKVVFVVDGDGRARVRPVLTGISSDTEIEIRRGLAVGTPIVEGPYRTLAKELKEGDRVEEAGGPGGPHRDAAVDDGGARSTGRNGTTPDTGSR